MNKYTAVICFGEVLWDNLIEGRRVGGAPLNVCYHLTNNGISGKIVSQIGRDENGTDLLAAINGLAVDTQFLRVSDTHPTSTVEVNLLGDGRVAYEILNNVAWDDIQLDPLVADAVKAADFFVYGSLAARNQVSRSTLFSYLKLARWAVFDVNFRQPFYTKELIVDLMTHCNTLKINDDEFAEISAWLGVNEETEQRAVVHFFERFPRLSEIILTKGALGAVYFDRHTTVAVNAVTIDCVNTVGSGDAFLAAFLAYRISNKSVREAMDYAALLSAFVAAHDGACPAYSDEELQDFNMRTPGSA